MLETFSQWIKSYGYLGVFGSQMLGMFGLPLPDETILTFTGFLIYKHYLHPLPALLAAYLGSICGITVNYLAGRFIGFPLLDKYGHHLRLTDERINQAHRWFESYGKVALFAGYFFPGLRHLMALSAGASRLDYRYFAPYAYSGGGCWVVTFIAIGYFLGEEWRKIAPQIQSYLWIAVGLVIFVSCLVYLVQRLRRPARQN
jgi:membrane protein DedA with SNARE-associated domain